MVVPLLVTTLAVSYFVIYHCCVSVPLFEVPYYTNYLLQNTEEMKTRPEKGNTVDNAVKTCETLPAVAGPSTEPDPSQTAPPGMWDGVLSSLEGTSKSYPPDSPFYNLPSHKVTSIVLGDHDYCRLPAATDVRLGLDHDYCDNR